ncbi:hypothetical protein [Sporosarcina sp. E16_8]|uniref:hypothetical protein n=1 Tax=Sporosarcina sp. E16_8 TaxID=2789295 RepID=UPI001A929EC3|nr:hypothetical protein [Sporosarcina sp. E16_8]MBO0586479.1 hypothetical protein [Sporosarcina sp. E16_8]
MEMEVQFSNMEYIIYCHNEAIAKEVFDFLMSRGYPVGMSGSQIETGTHGEQAVKRIDVYKKKN